MQLQAHSPGRAWSMSGVEKAGMKTVDGVPVDPGYHWEGGS